MALWLAVWRVLAAIMTFWVIRQGERRCIGRLCGRSGGGPGGGRFAPQIWGLKAAPGAEQEVYADPGEYPAGRE